CKGSGVEQSNRPSGTDSEPLTDRDDYGQAGCDLREKRSVEGPETVAVCQVDAGGEIERRVLVQAWTLTGRNQGRRHRDARSDKDEDNVSRVVDRPFSSVS